MVFDAEYVSAGDQAMWSQLSGAEWSLTLGELRASQRGDMAVGLMDAQLYDLVPDIGVPPIDDPVALAKWLLT